MKFVILALLILAAFAADADPAAAAPADAKTDAAAKPKPTYEKFQYKTGDEVLQKLQTYDDSLYVIFFSIMSQDITEI